MNEQIKLPELILHKFLFNLVFLEDALLPEFKGSTFRGAVGWHLKKSVQNLTPVYEHIFETKGGENDPSFLKGVSNVPHPFILHPPLEEKRFYKNGELITVGISLIGYAHNFLPFFIEAFEQMGVAGLTSKKHKFKLLSVFNEDYYSSRYVVFQNGSTKISKNYFAITLMDVLKNANYSSDSIRINFETPFVLQDKSVTIDGFNKEKITPLLIVRTLENRYKSLAQYYCRSITDENILFQPDQSVKVSKIELTDYKLQRYSNRLNEKQTFEGLKGSIVLEGNLKSILPLLYIGEIINIGKKTSFGWGQYKLENHI